MRNHTSPVPSTVLYNSHVQIRNCSSKIVTVQHYFLIRLFNYQSESFISVVGSCGDKKINIITGYKKANLFFIRNLTCAERGVFWRCHDSRRRFSNVVSSGLPWLMHVSCTGVATLGASFAATCPMT